MRLSELLQSAGVQPRRSSGDAEVVHVADDSRRCRPGACFLAVRGAAADGHDYIPAAVEAGAASIVCEDPAAVPDGVAFAVVEDARRAAGPIAQAALGWPARQLAAVGVTGTNGKTTVAHLIREILHAAGHRPALLGTIAYETGGQARPAPTTTPGPVALAAMTAEMVAAGKTHLVMEVSSHALDQRRTGGVAFAAGVFTNLSGDHLDYHGTLDAYLAAKARLFADLPPEASAVVNRDDPHWAAIAGAGPARRLLYGFDPAADVRGRIERADAGGTAFELTAPTGQAAVRTALIGRHNVSNCLAAAAACVALGVDLGTIAATLSAVGPVRGRLEAVPADAPFATFVDYAHTDDALANVLDALAAVEHRRLLVIFGCGGDRDRTKRPRMARVAAARADRIFVTSDNPRTEDPDAIVAEIVAGFANGDRQRVTVEPDRRAAIGLAVREAEPGDVVLIAGKGHETYQILGDRRVDFDDAEVAAAAIRSREGAA